MPTTCPKCGATIPADDINVGKDVAFCRKCDSVFTLSGLAGAIVPAPVNLGPPVDLANPPRGAWYRDEGGTVRVGSSTRSGSAFFFVFFALFWNSITWFFVSMFLMELFKPGTMPVKSHGQPMPTAFGLLFMIPFVLVGLVTGAIALMGLFGRVEVTIRGGTEGEVFTGVGPVGWRRTFDPAAVTGVTIQPTGWTQNGQRQVAVSLDGTDVRFGTFLSDLKKSFVAAALRKSLV